MSLLNWSILNWSVLNNSLLNWFSLTSLSLTVTLELVCLELVSLELSLMVELEMCQKFVVLTRNDPQVSLELPLLNKCHLNGLTIDRRGFQHIYSRIYTALIHMDMSSLRDTVCLLAEDQVQSADSQRFSYLW